MIIDCTTFNGEHELSEIRYNILSPYVDEFRVIEFDKTFSGKPKESTFKQECNKVKHYYVTEDIWSKYEYLASVSPNTQYGTGAKHWITEFCMKESIQDCLEDIEPNATLLIGDVDEIWIPQALDLKHAKLKLDVYTYWLNNKSSEQFWGTIICRYGDIKNKVLNHVRSGAPKSKQSFGWHFTSQGGYGKIRDKLTDSYTRDSYANDSVLDSLENNIQNNKDFLGRDFKYEIDESEWPRYLKRNKNKYKHLIK